MQLNRHNKKLEVGDEVYVVRRSRYPGNPGTFHKHKVEKVYKNSNVIVNGDQYRCRSTFNDHFYYERTRGQSSWLITPRALANQHGGREAYR